MYVFPIMMSLIQLDFLANLPTETLNIKRSIEAAKYNLTVSHTYFAWFLNQVFNDDFEN